MNDIAMINGDLVVDDFGDIVVISDSNDDIIQMANHNVMTILGENIFHPDVGNNAHNKRLKFTPSYLIEIESDSSDAILRDIRVKSVLSIKAEKGSYNECIITYKILTVNDDILDSRISINIF